MVMAGSVRIWFRVVPGVDANRQQALSCTSRALPCAQGIVRVSCVRIVHFDNRELLYIAYVRYDRMIYVLVARRYPSRVLRPHIQHTTGQHSPMWSLLLANSVHAQ